jgi:hypothetical protein
MFADAVRVYDDRSTDDSIEIIRSFPEVILTENDRNSGSPVWGSSQSIIDADTTHLAWIDSDDFMVRRPEETDADYTFFDMQKVTEDGRFIRLYRRDRPTTYPEAIEAFKAGRLPTPFPWGGVWKTAFLNGKKWVDFDCSAVAPDTRTAIEWARDKPTLRYIQAPYLAHRQHPGRMSQDKAKLAVISREVDSLRGLL